MPARLVLAATSPIVALREELFYRAILQRTLQRSLGPFFGLITAAVLFTLYHIGAQPMNGLTVTMIFSAGITLGMLYEYTRNIWVPVALHTAWDVIYALMPPVAWIDWTSSFYLNIAVVCAMFVWWAFTAEERSARG